MKPIDYVGTRGQFMDDDGNRRDPSPEDVQNAPIIANPWKMMTEHGAMQAKCTCCGGLVGLAPASQKMMEINPDRIVICIACYERMRRLVTLKDLADMTFEQFEAALEKLFKEKS